MWDLVFKFGDWIQEKLKVKSGVFVLGLFAGAIIPSTSFYFTNKELNRLNDIISQYKKEKDDILADKNQWQERAFNSEQACLNRLKDMAKFFNELEEMYRLEEENRKEQLLLEQQKIRKYENISNQLTNLKRDLK